MQSIRVKRQKQGPLQAELSVDNNETSARMVKARLEKTTLGQVTAHIKAVLQPSAGFISICLDLEVIAKLQLSVTPRSVGMSLMKHTKLKLKTENIRYSMPACVVAAAVTAGPALARESTAIRLCSIGVSLEPACLIFKCKNSVYSVNIDCM